MLSINKRKLMQEQLVWYTEHRFLRIDEKLQCVNLTVGNYSKRREIKSSANSRYTCDEKFYRYYLQKTYTELPTNKITGASN